MGSIYLFFFSCRNRNWTDDVCTILCLHCTRSHNESSFADKNTNFVACQHLINITHFKVVIEVSFCYLFEELDHHRLKFWVYCTYLLGILNINKHCLFVSYEYNIHSLVWPQLVWLFLMVSSILQKWIICLLDSSPQHKLTAVKLDI